jgi:aspartate beta-hydroxylase
MHTSEPSASSLLRTGAGALQKGDPAAALHAFAAAEAADPGMAEAYLNQALACRVLEDWSTGIAALDRLLVKQPRHVVALLSKGALLESAAGERAAARVYRQALGLTGEGEVPSALAPLVRQARAVVARDTARLEAFLRDSVAPLRADHAGAALERFDESLAVFAGAIKPPAQRPMLLHYTRLAPIPFYDRALFPWLPELEAATDTIAAECRSALAEADAEFVPYIRFPPNVAVHQWGELNHSRKWSSFFLWKDGVRHDGACRQCPLTAALVDRLPLMHQPGFAPTAVFSALQPHTRIPPHTGSSNARLLCHLPLILPGPARFRVGPVTRDWKLGEAWVFDDTIEHEAWNDADELRVILILDLWNPFLSEAEKSLIGAMMAARNAYYAG